jgi:hypothetical protein
MEIQPLEHIREVVGSIINAEEEYIVIPCSLFIVQTGLSRIVMNKYMPKYDVASEIDAKNKEIETDENSRFLKTNAFPINLLGNIMITESSIPNKKIVRFFCQRYNGKSEHDNDKPTKLTEWFVQCLNNLLKHLEPGTKVAFSTYMCSQPGQSWFKTLGYIVQFSDTCPVTLYKFVGNRNA